MQAESVINLLKDAYRELTKAKSELEAIYENPPHGLGVAPDGVITHPEGSNAAQGDVDVLVRRSVPGGWRT
ncbi:hypothetical protein [Streptomyces vilmorinianum]|uniref:hypothetical protein n=1 Tax=Streptomyces vilmorinianum TaxID=3051092 RepID=UPI0010FB4AB1|nr:hypothetical protein [Streptomyces vilmorinianum]